MNRGSAQRVVRVLLKLARQGRLTAVSLLRLQDFRMLGSGSYEELPGSELKIEPDFSGYRSSLQGRFYVGHVVK